MSKCKRYTLKYTVITDAYDLVEDDNGDWVRYRDYKWLCDVYQKLQARYAELGGVHKAERQDRLRLQDRFIELESEKAQQEERIAELEKSLESTLLLVHDLRNHKQFDDWTPTTQNINSLPQKIREYVAALETQSDPRGMVHQNTLVKDNCRILENRHIQDKEKIQRYEQALSNIIEYWNGDTARRAMLGALCQIEEIANQALNSKFPNPSETKNSRIKPPNTIPLMTGPSGRYWNQPPRDSIKFRGRKSILSGHVEVALMNDSVFKQLPEYSTSIPSVAYSGKMWKRKGRNEWYLCWFEDHDENTCKINTRQIYIIHQDKGGN